MIAGLRARREGLLAGGLLLLLALITAVAAVGESRSVEPPALSSASSAPNGALALRLWLEEIGFQIADSPEGAYRPPLQANFAVILQPLAMIRSNDQAALEAWVKAGGTLILAGDNWATALAMERFDVTLSDLSGTFDELTVETPWFSPPPAAAALQASARSYLETGRDDVITHLSADGKPVLISLRLGEGQVFLASEPGWFSNQALKESEAPWIVANLFGVGKRRLRMIAWFDELHHGAQAQGEAIVGPEQWLRRAPAGQALLYAAGVALLALALGGRRFGRAVPPARETTRRRPLEHVAALANLSRLAGHRAETLRAYHRRLKRSLGGRYRLDPSLPDDEWVRRLAAMRPGLDAPALLDLLTRLRRPRPTEAELVRWAREAAEWIEKG